jgi:RNA recognition motif-containing protein
MFAKFGKLKRCGIHWDKVGISLGSADIEYENFRDAEKAMQELDGNIIFNILLGQIIEGQRIYIELN